MGWFIKCLDSQCGMETWAVNIVDLIDNHRDKDGWFVCKCGQQGYVEKNYDLQEPGETWKPVLKGIINLSTKDKIYQPFAFLVSYDKPNNPVEDIWVSYYKDMRKAGGRLKLGYGPGGPPVLGKKSLLQLLVHMRDVGCLTQEEIDKELK